MSSGAGVPRNTHWSWRQLVRRYGEEGALALLQLQPGLGEFMGHILTGDTGWDGPVGAGYEDIHDEVPAGAFLCPVSPLDLDTRPFADQRSSLRSILASYWQYDCGSRYLGTPWAGERAWSEHINLVTHRHAGTT